ncbi:MAG: hypothetical protein K8H88_24605 [Sandaracinaceae bacterium]|nr:hypothetical protein [Sandaracinaceae bacterium]
MSELLRRSPRTLLWLAALATVPACLLDYDVAGIEVAPRPLAPASSAVFDELRFGAMSVEAEGCISASWRGAWSQLAPSRAYAHHPGHSEAGVDWHAPGSASWHVVVPECATSLVVTLEALSARGLVDQQGTWRAWEADGPGQIEVRVPIEGDQRTMSRIELALDSERLAAALDPALPSEDLGLDLLVAVRGALSAHASP